MRRLASQESVLDSRYSGGPEDAALVARAQAGEKDALEKLIERHQPWIYNIALRMVGGPEDAEDVAQEILVKVITKLSTFRQRSSFRTWLYRIVINHVLTMRRRPWERLFSSFDAQAELMDRLELDSTTVRGSPVEEQVVAAETQAGCMTGMLLCLDRSQRVALILGVFFGVDSRLGGALLDTTAQNYRQILSRARKQLGNFMADRCGLMDPANPCRCTRKTHAAIEAGLVDPLRLRFNLPYLGRIRDFVAQKTILVQDTIDRRLGELLRDQPFYSSPRLERVLRVMLKRGDLGQLVSFR